MALELNYMYMYVDSETTAAQLSCLNETSTCEFTLPPYK